MNDENNEQPQDNPQDGNILPYEDITSQQGNVPDGEDFEVNHEVTDSSETDELSEQDEPVENVTATLTSALEAVLFASDEPLSIVRLSAILETTAALIRENIKTLNAEYKQNNHAFRIEKIADGFQMLTLAPYNVWLQKLLRARTDSKLTPAALETLAIIAYKQPIIRADVEAIRGVAAGEMIRTLMQKGLVKIVGRAEVLGRPMLYGTTKKFLEVFGLNTLKDLPKVEELKKAAPTQEANVLEQEGQ